MKKTLITSTLIAALAAPAVMAQDTTEQTSDYTIGLGSGASYNTGANGNYYGWTMALTGSYLDATAATTDAPALGALSSVLLDSVTINNRTSGSQTYHEVYLAIYEYAESGTTGTFIGVSDNTATNNQVNGSNTFTFTDVTLAPDKQYQYLFVTSNDTTTLETYNGYTSVASNFGLELGQFSTQTPLPGGDDLYTNGQLTGTQSGEYMANVSIGVSVTPEPTTATLSLLALAGLCARRRRK